MHNNTLTPFAFDDALVRVHMDEDGNHWFVAKDVALALGYQWNGSACISHVPEEWQRVRSVLTHSRGKQEMLCLTEQGLYFFLGRSDKPKALPFQKWLAGEVLPALRKTGQYTMPGCEVEDAGEEQEVCESGNAAFLELPPAVKRMSVRDRKDCMSFALQMARQTNIVNPADIYTLFLSFCMNLCSNASALPQRPKENERANVRLFVEECCEQGNPKRRVPLNSIYNAYRDWCHDQERPLEPVTRHKFMEYLARVAPWCKIIRANMQGSRIWFVGNLNLQPASVYNLSS